MVIDNQKKEIPCGWLPQGSFFATGEVASGWCHNGGRFYRPSLCRINVPRILPSTLVSRESITSPMVIVTTSLPCRIGLVGPWQLQYNTTDDKTPTAMPAAVGVFIWKFIHARNRRLPPYARSRPPHLHVRQSVRRCGHRSPRRRRSPPPRRVPPAPCGR